MDKPPNETVCGLITRFLDDHDALVNMLRNHGSLRCHGRTLRYQTGGQILVLACEWPGTKHASELDGPASFVVAADREPSDLWRGRLVFDAAVSDSSPVIGGTWVTVSKIVSLVVDGWSWSDILRAHPEIDENDIRAALAYTIAQDEEPPRVADAVTDPDDLTVAGAWEVPPC